MLAIRRALIVLLTCVVALPALAQAQAPEDQLQDELRKLEVLTECLERTDPARGQNQAWRDAHCPSSDEAIKAQIRQLKQAIEETKEAIAEASQKAKKGPVASDPAEKVKEATEGANADPARKAKSVKGSSRLNPSLRLPGLAVPPASSAFVREQGALPFLCAPVLPSPAFSLTAGEPMFSDPLPVFGAGIDPTPQLLQPGSVLCDLPELDLATSAPSFRTTLGLPPIPSPTLDIHKRAEDLDDSPISGVVPGETFQYRITLTNTSVAGDPLDAQIVDDIPSSLTFNGFAADTGVNCAWDTDVLTCSVPALEIGETRSVVVTVTLPSDHCDATIPEMIIQNIALARILVQDAPVVLDQHTAVIGVDCLGLLSVTKVAVPFLEDEIQSGSIFQYNITLTNQDDEARTGRIIDDLPNEFDFLALSASNQWDCSASDGDVVNCTTDLEPEQSRGLTIFMLVPEDFCSLDDRRPFVVNTVRSFFLLEGVGDVPSGIAVETTYVPCSDVSIDKTHDGGELVPPGSEITFLIHVVNRAKSGEDTIGRATGVVVTDEIPDGFEVLEPLPEGCTLSEENVLTCDIGWLEVDEEVFLEIPVRVIAPECGPLENRATVEAANEWPLHKFPWDNGSTTTVNVECVPNITITKSAEVDGRDITYTITAANTGTAEATGVVVTDNLDNDLHQVEATPSQGSCVVGLGNNVGCELGNILVDGSATVTITARIGVGACPTVVNQAEGSAVNEPEGARDDNSDRVRTSVDCVLGTTTTRDGVVLGSLAATGLGLVPLLLLAGALLAAGEVARRRSRKGKHAA